MHAIVIGAGIIGLSTAWALRGRGVTVTLIDPAPGHGATHAAAGMIAPAAEVVWGQTPLYPLMAASAKLWPDFASTLATESGKDLGVTATETLVAAGDRADLAALRELIAAQRAAGFDAELITGSAARGLEPALAPGVSGAVRIPGDWAIDPRRVSAALIDSLGDCIINATATAIDPAHGTVTLDDGRSLRGDEIVIAAGARCNDIAGVPRLPLREVWGEVLRLRAPSHLTPLLTRTVRGLVNGRPVYVVPRPDGQLVLGATSREDGRSGKSAGGIFRLLRDVERLVPGVLECDITDITTRARPGSPDDIPLIGRLAPGLTVSTGYFRHGILLAPLGARLTADIAVSATGDWIPRTLSSTHPTRFERGRS